MNTRPSSNSPNRSDLDTSTGHSPASDFDYAGSISASSSVNSSPAVIPKAIQRAKSGSPRRRTTPPYQQNNSHDRLSLDMGRPSSAAGKGGCWYVVASPIPISQHSLTGASLYSSITPTTRLYSNADDGIDAIFIPVAHQDVSIATKGAHVSCTGGRLHQC